MHMKHALHLKYIYEQYIREVKNMTGNFNLKLLVA